MSYVLLLLFFLVEYVRPTSYVPALMVLKLNLLIPVGAFVGSLASGSAAAAKEWIVSDNSSRVVLGMLSIVGLSVITSDVQEIAWARFTAVAGFVIIYWVLASELRTVARIQGVFAMLVLVHLIIAALNPALFTNADQRTYIASGSFLGDGNDFALSLTISIPLCLFLFLNAKVSLRPIWAAALLLLVACVVLTQSRGGTLGLGAMALYYWFKNPKKLQTGTIAVLVVVLILALAPSAYFTRMNQIGDTTEGSASGRITAWGVAIRMALDHPLFGVGAGHFPTMFAEAYLPEGYDNRPMTAHSVYFLALGELGFPGLALLIYYVVASLRANQRLAAEVRRRHGSKVIDLQLLASTSAAVIAFAVAGAFLSCLYYPHLYIIAGLQAAVRNVVRNRCLQQEGVMAPVASRPREIAIHPALRPSPGRSLVTGPPR
jgi:probable O-glycosylation ligase (exosortase A-associated)